MSVLGNRGRLEQFKTELDRDLDPAPNERFGPAHAVITIYISKAAGCGSD
ncbi:hypothetical protein [Halobaculum sp. MBLA0143]